MRSRSRKIITTQRTTSDEDDDSTDTSTNSDFPQQTANCTTSEATFPLTTTRVSHSDKVFLQPRCEPKPHQHFAPVNCSDAQNKGDAATCCTEPFWILPSKSNGQEDEIAKNELSVWILPDEFSEQLLDTAISDLDKHMFWEMMHTLVTLPSLADFDNKTFDDGRDEQTLDVFKTKLVDGTHKQTFLKKLLNPTYLASLLARVECRILWIDAAVDLLPPSVMTAIVQAKFCSPSKASCNSILEYSVPYSRRQHHQTYDSFRGAHSYGHFRRHTYGHRVATKW